MNEDAPLACNMSIFTPVQRENHIQATTQLFQQVQSVQEVKHGYMFIFPHGTESISGIAEFISNERLCCPFLDFDLHIGAADRPISLSITGPAGTREFLQEEFNGAFQ